MREVWLAWLVAWGFATRVPVRVATVSPRMLAAAISCLPAVGLVLGAGAYGVARLCAPALGNTLAAIAAVAFAALITGGLHLDGLADLFDALGGGRGERQRMLDIMRDPRIGAHGASALLLVVLAKVAAIAELDATRLPLALCMAPAASRLMAVWLLYLLPAARTDGLGHGMGEALGQRDAWVATGIVVAAGCAFGPHSVAPTLAAVFCAAALGWLARARLGGVTGDVCGAAIELSELAFVLVCRSTQT
ncbi:MAG: adenosylcobinamide-GDP ribazoletransferase [Polyangiales bacterium]